MIKYQAESSEYFVVEIYYDDSLIKKQNQEANSVSYLVNDVEQLIV